MNSQETNEAKLAHIADQVQHFYDRRPYPPPVKDLETYRRQWRDLERRRADFHLHWPNQPYQEKLNILIAGCGTSQAAKHALCQPEARVVGIDVSATSIQHTKDLKHQYHLTNLEIHQLPIEQVHELGQNFDKIVCTGVLHHLSEPDAGLHALRSVLKQDGAMNLMVYAHYGRSGVYMLQEYCRRLGIGSSDLEIQELANTLMALPQEHPLAYLLGQSPDFRSKAGLADALLHPQDRAYTVPQLFDFIDRAGLTFGRWVRQAPYLPQCGDVVQTPHSSRLIQIPPQEQYAAIELFRGTMVRHNVIVYHSDQPGDSQPIRFDNERWQDYVPIRLPRTLCIEERLPPGAVAVLINQSHSYPDLVLPINALEKQLFDAIDGQRSIIEILDKVTINESRNNERARIFFERLWCYDQVVFNATCRKADSSQ